MQYSRVSSALSNHFTVMNEGKFCTQASKTFMLPEPNQLSDLNLDYDSDEYKTDTETLVEEWGL
jgi:hypothetical protein